MAKLIQGEGEDQGSCDRCNELGIWNRHWMVMLYQVASDSGKLYNSCYYCRKHAEEFKNKIEYQQEWGIFE